MLVQYWQWLNWHVTGAAQVKPLVLMLLDLVLDELHHQVNDVPLQIVPPLLLHLPLLPLHPIGQGKHLQLSCHLDLQHQSSWQDSCCRAALNPCHWYYYLPSPPAPLLSSALWPNPMVKPGRMMLVRPRRCSRELVCSVKCVVQGERLKLTFPHPPPLTFISTRSHQNWLIISISARRYNRILYLENLGRGSTLAAHPVWNVCSV